MRRCCEEYLLNDGFVSDWGQKFQMLKPFLTGGQMIGHVQDGTKILYASLNLVPNPNFGTIKNSVFSTIPEFYYRTRISVPIIPTHTKAVSPTHKSLRLRGGCGLCWLCWQLLPSPGCCCCYAGRPDAVPYQRCQARPPSRSA